MHYGAMASVFGMAENDGDFIIALPGELEDGPVFRARLPKID
jgi:hypothetical protein